MLSKNLLPKASDEQEAIIKAVIAGDNIRTDSTYGTGKTMVIVFVGEYLPHKKILVITYNTELRINNKSRVENNKLENIDMHTYHSFCASYFNINFDGNSYEKTIKDVISGNVKLKKDIDYDIIIFDEIQDMTIEYYRVSKRILQYCLNKNNQLILIGDKDQCIYDFGSSPADPRFLTLAHKLYENRKFTDLQLRYSYRSTRQIAGFQTFCLKGEKTIISDREGPKVQLIMGNSFEAHIHIMKYLDEISFKPEEIFVLASSVKRGDNQKPIHYLENALVDRKIPIYVSSDNICPDHIIKNLDLSKGKTVFTTFCKSKGRERRIVICYGFDSDFFKYNRKLEDIGKGKISPYKYPNQWYVGNGRSLEHLIIVGGKYAPHWMKEKPPEWCCNVIGNFQTIDFCISGKYIPSISVTDFIKYKSNGESFEKIQRLYKSLLKKNTDHRGIRGSDINPVIKCSRTYENVSDITSEAISMMYRKNIDVDDLTSEKISKFLKKAINKDASRTGYKYRKKQIDRFDWLSVKNVKCLLGNFRSFISARNITFEFDKERRFRTKFGNIIDITARLDAIINGTTIYEFKLVQELKPEHFLQLILYMWVTEKEKYRKYVLLNLKTGECYIIQKDENSKKVIREIVDVLIEIHYNTANCNSDEEFLKKVLSD